MLRDALVVDDEAEGRDALSQLLEARGYTVRQAENGLVALDLIIERVPGFMVLDLDMPVMSGWEVLASLRRAGALHAITVVVVSAAGGAPPIDVSFLRKPCAIDDLLSMLATADHRGHGAVASPPTGQPLCFLGPGRPSGEKAG